jgi:hypothetical protein
MKILPKTANQIYDILVKDCIAPESQREMFLACQKEDCQEYRFQGIFGFGGKFYSSSGTWYVNGYPEDKTPETEQVREMVNKKLVTLLERSTLSSGPEPDF